MLERFQRPVRCSANHVYTTIWVPLGSLKAVRLGRRRFQHCPVGRHWAWVTRLDAGSASAEELQAAARVHDTGIP
jgi:hypothetical protein